MAATVPVIPAREGYFIDLKPPQDSDADRDRMSRLLVFLLTTTAVVVPPVVLGVHLGSLATPFMAKLGALAGIVAGGILLTKIINRLLIYNREWSAYVTNDALKGVNVPYGPGLHVSFPWEQRNKAGNFSLEVISKTFVVMVQTKTARVEATGVFQYAVDLARITNFAGVDETTITDGFVGFLQSFLTEKLANKTAEAARTHIGEINKDLSLTFRGMDSDGTIPTTTSVKPDFEEKYGITTVSIVISNFNLPAAAQKTRDAIDEAETLHRVVAGFLGIKPSTLSSRLSKGTITKDDYKEYLNRAMATSENATMDIKVFEVPNLSAIIDQIFSRFGSGKPSTGAGEES